MIYKFEKHDWSGTIIYGVTAENKILNNFGRWNWTSTKIQEIIDGVTLGKTKPYGEEFNWASEDLEVYVNLKGVLLIDMIAHRAGKQDKESTTLEISHEEFLKFLNDFKKFIEANS
jgi:hypothetical protein